MVFEPVSSEQRKQFFRQNYGSHLPGYTGHCPTLKFRVGKRFGANTEDIMKIVRLNQEGRQTRRDLLEKKILKNGPYRPNSGRDVLAPIELEKNIRRDWKNETNYYKSSPFILGYTGYIPGFNTSYGLPFMRAVEQGGKEWREKQNKLRSKRDILRSTNPRNLARARQSSDNVDVEVDHGHHQSYFDNQVSSERPPIVGYTGHIPGAKSEVALSRRYAQAAKKGLELLQKVRESRRLDRHRNFDSNERVLDTNYLDDTGHTRT